MEIADEPRPGPARRRSRWVLATSVVLAGLGTVILGLSLQPPAAPGLAADHWHLATHAGDAVVVPGLAVHRPEGTGPAVATLAAELSPVASPASIVAVALTPPLDVTTVPAWPDVGATRNP